MTEMVGGKRMICVPGHWGEEQLPCQVNDVVSGKKLKR